MKFNLNNYVRVRLTDYGHKIYREEWEELRKTCLAIHEYRSPKEDENGWSKWQLWQLMETFGPYISLAGPYPFEMEIEIVTNE